MDDFLKLFSGSWVHSRDENIKESMEKMKMPQEDIAFIMTTKPTMTIERQGDKIFHRTTLIEGVNHDITYELGKEFEAKDEKADPPLFHNKMLVTFDGTKAKYLVKSQLTGPRKIDTVNFLYFKDGELVWESSAPKDNDELDTSSAGRRIYKKKQ